MPEPTESGAALHFLDWSQEGVDGLKQIKYHIVSACRVFFGQSGSLFLCLVGSILLGDCGCSCLLKMYTTDKLVVLVVARRCLIYVVYIYE